MRFQPTFVGLFVLLTVPMTLRISGQATADEAAAGKERIVHLQFQGEERFRGCYLDAGGTEAMPHLCRQAHAGTRWRVLNAGDGTVRLQSLAHTRIQDAYLDVGGRSPFIRPKDTPNGKVPPLVVLRFLENATGRWRITAHDDGSVEFVNEGDEPYGGCFLAIDVEKSFVVLSKQSNANTRWHLTEE